MTTGDGIIGLLPTRLGLHTKRTFSGPVRIIHSVAERTSSATPNVLLRVMLLPKAEWDMPGSLSPGASFFLGAESSGELSSWSITFSLLFNTV